MLWFTQPQKPRTFIKWAILSKRNTTAKKKKKKRKNTHPIVGFSSLCLLSDCWDGHCKTSQLPWQHLLILKERGGISVLFCTRPPKEQGVFYISVNTSNTCNDRYKDTFMGKYLHFRSTNMFPHKHLHTHKELI